MHVLDADPLSTDAPVQPRDAGVAGLRCDTADIVELVGMSMPEGGALWVRANSRSMEPTIPLGADIRLVPVTHLAVGSVVLARVRNDLLVLHRVHAIDGESVYLRGDASGKSDPAVRRSDVLACADLVVSQGREYPVGPRPMVSVVDVKRWLRPLTKRVRKIWSAL